LRRERVGVGERRIAKGPAPGESRESVQISIRRNK
jgi:hypothetical protein